MTYKINLYGKGNEFCIGTIKKETWDYIQENFDGYESAYCSALDNGEIPEEHQLAPESWSFYECDDQWHEDGCWASWYKIEILDENDNEVFSVTNDNVKDSGVIEHTDYYSIDDKIPYLCTWSSVAKGLYLTGEFDVDGEFDPTKLTINYKQVSFDHDDWCDTIVSSFEYDGKTLDCEFDSTDGKGDTLRFVEVAQYEDDEEEVK